MSNSDKKNQNAQIAALGVLLVVVGWLFYDVLFSSSTSGVPSRPAQVATQSANDGKGGVRFVQEVETLQVTKDEPQRVDLSIELNQFVNPEVLRLNEEIRTDELRLKSKKLKAELAELDQKPEGKPEQRLTFFPAGLGGVPDSTPSVSQPVEVERTTPSDYSKGSEDQGERSVIKPPSYDSNALFGHLTVSSLVSSHKGASGWLRASDRSFKVFEGMVFGDYTVDSISNEYIEVRHLPSNLSRKLNAPGIGYQPSNVAPVTSFGASQPAPSYGGTQMDDDLGGSGIPIDMPIEMIR